MYCTDLSLYYSLYYQPTVALTSQYNTQVLNGVINFACPDMDVFQLLGHVAMLGAGVGRVIEDPATKYHEQHLHTDYVYYGQQVMHDGVGDVSVGDSGNYQQPPVHYGRPGYSFHPHRE